MRPLRLEYRNSALRPPAAWLIDGGDAAAWLAEIARWGVDDSRCRLQVLPRSSHDLTAGSVLVLTAGQTPAVAPAAAPFGIVAGKIFLPTDAALLPAATDAELAALVSGEAIVFHPALGAITCGHPLAIADLLRVATEMDEPFADVRPVHLAYPRIEAIGFRVQESLGDMLDGMRDGIGSEPPATLEPTPDEPSGTPLARSLRKLREGALRAGARLIAGSGKGGPLGKMREWVEKRLRALGEELENVRNREIRRLLEKFRDNPDEALRHALPLAAPPNRGLAPPSAHLGERTPDFNLNRLRGGGPGDAWRLDQELRRKLRENYVRVAERERQLGRFRRAAYIYAELLGDLASAALVLKEGRHWREAAMLYRDHLRMPLDAARCFVEARMPAEAVPLFEKENAWGELGGLYRKLGDNAAADSAFRAFVRKLLESGMPRVASVFLITQLNARDEALAILAAQWPDGAEPDACVKRLFELHGKAGEHAAACDAIGSLLAQISRSGPTTPVPEWLADVARNYPDRAVRLVAEDAGRQRIAHSLPAAAFAERKRLISRLNDLAPEDRLLPRDVRRFLDAPPPRLPAAPRKSPMPEPGHTVLTLHRVHQIPHRGFKWTKAVAGNQAIVVAGFTTRSVHVTRLEFDGASAETSWSLETAAAPPRFIMTPPGVHLSHIFLAVASAAPLLIQTLRGTSEATIAERSIGTPSWADSVLDAAMGTSAIWLLRAAPHGWVISGHKGDGSLVGQFALEAALNPAAMSAVPPDWHPTIVACNGAVLVSYVHLLVIFRGGVGRQVVDCDAAILGLVSSPHWALPHVAVVMPDGVDICWLNDKEPAIFPAIRDLETQPVAGFSSDSTLIVIAGAAGYLITPDRQGWRKVTRFEWDGTVPAAAILPGPSAQTFTVVEHTGRVTVWRFSKAAA